MILKWAAKFRNHCSKRQSSDKQHGKFRIRTSRTALKLPVHCLCLDSALLKSPPKITFNNYGSICFLFCFFSESTVYIFIQWHNIRPEPKTSCSLSHYLGKKTVDVKTWFPPYTTRKITLCWFLEVIVKWKQLSFQKKRLSSWHWDKDFLKQQTKITNHKKTRRIKKLYQKKPKTPM